MRIAQQLVPHLMERSNSSFLTSLIFIDRKINEVRNEVLDMNINEVRNKLLDHCYVKENGHCPMFPTNNFLVRSFYPPPLPSSPFSSLLQSDPAENFHTSDRMLSGDSSSTGGVVTCVPVPGLQ